MLGGMTGAMMLPAAIRPAERPRLCPASTIIGTSNAASAAASATAEPESDASRQDAMIAT
ncbi:hypothetical protein D3C76_1614060 [compost metagenome]